MGDATSDGAELPEEQVAFEMRLRRRAGCQRRLMIIGGLWVIGWAGMILNDFIRFTTFQFGWWSAALFDLIFSPFVAVVLLVPAILGRVIGNIRPFDRFKYYLTFAVPIATVIAMNIPALLIRIEPERKLEHLLDAPMPAGARLVSYESIHYGRDPVVKFGLRGSDDALDDLIRVMRFRKKAGHSAEKYKRHEEGKGRFTEMEIDRSAGKVELTFSWY